MKILCVGDSWTRAYGVETHQSWPQVLNQITEHDIDVLAWDGARNDELLNALLKSLDHYNPNLIIIGWSGITRFDDFSLCYSLEENVDSEQRHKFFTDKSLFDIQRIWYRQRKLINTIAKQKSIEVAHFSVFGDDPGGGEELNLSPFLNWLAEQQDIKFKYNIPIFEFDFLHENNKITYEFADKYFGKDWIKACVEREQIRIENQSMFLNCGHPNARGHSLWAHYVKNKLNL